MRDNTDNIRRGVGVWHPEYGNGVITNVDWIDAVVDVEFDYMNMKTMQVIDMDDLFGNWDGKLQQWVIPSF